MTNLLFILLFLFGCSLKNNIEKEVIDLLQCKECEYSTPKQSNLKRHIQSKHPADVNLKLQKTNVAKTSSGGNYVNSKIEKDQNSKVESKAHYNNLKSNANFY